jgi:hypothetical protein
MLELGEADDLLVPEQGEDGQLRAELVLDDVAANRPVPDALGGHLPPVGKTKAAFSDLGIKGEVIGGRHDLCQRELFPSVRKNLPSDLCRLLRNKLPQKSTELLFITEGTLRLKSTVRSICKHTCTWGEVEK